MLSQRTLNIRAWLETGATYAAIARITGTTRSAVAGIHYRMKKELKDAN